MHIHSSLLPDSSCFPILTPEGWAGGTKISFDSADEQQPEMLDFGLNAPNQEQLFSLCPVSWPAKDCEIPQWFPQ